MVPELWLFTCCDKTVCSLCVLSAERWQGWWCLEAVLQLQQCKRLEIVMMHKSAEPKRGLKYCTTLAVQQMVPFVRKQVFNQW